MDYYFTRGEDRSEQIKKHIKEAAQSIIDHADDIVDQYDLLTDLKIEMNLNPDNDWLPKVQVLRERCVAGFVVISVCSLSSRLLPFASSLPFLLADAGRRKPALR
mgnify:CR=1 FL=1